MSEAQHKRGDTFDLSGLATITGVTDFTGWTGRCQVRTANDTLVEALTFAWLDVSTGLMRIYAAGPTVSWPVGLAYLDIEFTSPSSDVVSTQTSVVHIVKDITV